MRILLIFGITFICLTAGAQHSALYSQFTFNNLLVNPAYAGSNDALNLSTFYRAQWKGLEGAPETFGITAHTPLKNKAVNAGLSVVNDKFGVNTQTHFNAIYAYRINMMRGSLSFGLNGGVGTYRYNWNNIHTTDNGDPSFPANAETKIFPEAGFGIYYYNSRMFAGLAAPVLFSDTKKDILSYKPYLLHFGYLMKLGEGLEMKSAVQLKYLQSSPFQTELSTILYWKQILGTGIGYRTDDAITIFFDLRFNEQLSAGYSYDYTLSPLRNYSSGSHEITMRYLFGYKINPQSPRYF